MTAYFEAHVVPEGADKIDSEVMMRFIYSYADSQRPARAATVAADAHQKLHQLEAKICHQMSMLTRAAGGTENNSLRNLTLFLAPKRLANKQAAVTSNGHNVSSKQVLLLRD